MNPYLKNVKTFIKYQTWWSMADQVSDPLVANICIMVGDWISGYKPWEWL